MNRKRREELARMAEGIEKAKKTIGDMNKSLREYLWTLENSGNYNARQSIRLSNQELSDFLFERKKRVLEIGTDYAILWAYLEAKGSAPDYQIFRDTVMSSLTLEVANGKKA